MTLSRRRSAASIAARALVALAVLVAAPARAQIAGENVNMVTGTEWPGGDPFLQRQNEPSIAVSSANSQHLFAGANDYRSVDVPFPFPSLDGQKMAGDAWAGVFKSLDGGQTWKSTLLPGYPQDTSPLGALSPARRCPAHYEAGTDPATATQACNAAADPVTRAGTDGMLYYGGIVFKRGTSFGQVVVSRFIDLNNKENGDVVANTDPMKFVDTVAVARSRVAPGAQDAAEFLDKPWIAVDVPRAGALTCTIRVPDPKTPTRALATRSFPGGAVYVAYVRFPEGEATSDVMVQRSLDCGATWSDPVKVNDDSSMLNQGPALAIDPTTGKLYVSWRRITWPEPPPHCGEPGAVPCPAPLQRDAILVSRSFSRGAKFTRPRVVASGFQPFDLPTTGSGFRATAMPTMAISVGPEGNKRRVHVAWAQRDANGDGRVVVATAGVGAGPASGAEADETDATAETWAPARAADADELPGRPGNFTRGHQLMPQLTFSQGRLVLVYYDSHYDHARSYYVPHAFNPLTGSFYDELKGPLAGPAPFGAQLDPEPWDPSTLVGIYAPRIDDASTRYVRHTLDARVGHAIPGDAPAFVTAELSRYRFGVRGDELAAANGGDLSVPGYDGPLSIVSQGKLRLLQQLELNPPNLPLFKNGTVPFLGDYIDVQGPAFVRTKTGWEFNSAFQSAPVFHAVWTSNQRVRQPPDGDWTKYTPVTVADEPPRFDDPSIPRVACSSGSEGTRNQDVYTSRISFGLEVSSPQNAKLLDPTYVRSFVIVARNATAQDLPVRFSVAAPGQVLASFRNDLGGALQTSEDAVVPPRSAIHRTVFVRLRSASASPAASLSVSVAQLALGGTCTIALGTCPLLSGGASGTLTLNPPGATFALEPPDGATAAPGESYAVTLDGTSLTDANWQNANWQNANWQNANWQNATLTSSDVNANWQNANWQNANWQNANWQNTSYWSVDLANWQNANWQNANWQNTTFVNANWQNANWQNANWQNAAVGDGPLQTGPVSDLNYLFRNTGNTTAAYDVHLVASGPVSAPLQAMATKTYVTADAQACARLEDRRSVTVASTSEIQRSLPRPSDAVPADPNAAHVTITLAPGEAAQLTVRAPLALAEMAALAAQLTPVAVAQGVATAPGSARTFAALPGSRQSTTLTLSAPSGGSVTAQVTPNVEGPVPVPTGVVSFLLTRADGGGTAFLGNAALSGGTAVLPLWVALQTGDTLTAFYGGDARYAGASALLNGTSTSLSTAPAAQVAPTDDVTFVASVTASGSAGLPSGVLTFDVDSTSVASTTLDGTLLADGTAPRPQLTTRLPLGAHQIRARYTAASTFVGSSASTLVDVGYATAAALRASPSPSATGQAVQVQAIVNRVRADGTLIFPAADSTCSACHAPHNTPGSNLLLPEIAALVAANGPLFAQGSFELYEVPMDGGDPTLLGSAALATHGAKASLPLPTTWAAGTHTLLGRFVPATGSGFFASEATASQAVLAVTATGLELTSSVSTVGQTQPVSFTAAVTSLANPLVPQPAVDAGGSVTFSEGSTLLGTAAVSGGVASFTYTFPSAGDHAITASYGGDAAYGAASGQLSQHVTWAAKAPMPTARTLFGTATLGGKIYAVGGVDAGSTRLATVEAYDPATNAWSARAPMSVARASLGLAAANGKLYAIGGSGNAAILDLVEEYDPATDTWVTKAPIPAARREHAVATLANGNVLVIGGINAGSNGLATVVEYDPVAQTWTSRGSLAQVRYDLATAVVGGMVYAIGGQSTWNAVTQDTSTSLVEEYDPATGSWTARTPMPTARNNLAAAALNGAVLAIGGNSAATGITGLVQIFDPVANAWTTGPPMPQPRWLVSAVTLGGKAYVLGGSSPIVLELAP